MPHTRPEYWASVWVWIGLDGFGWVSVGLDMFGWVSVGLDRF